MKKVSAVLQTIISVNTETTLQTAAKKKKTFAIPLCAATISSEVLLMTDDHVCVGEFVICLLKWNIISLSCGVLGNTRTYDANTFKEGNPEILLLLLLLFLLFFLFRLFFFVAHVCSYILGIRVILVWFLLNNNCGWMIWMELLWWGDVMVEKRSWRRLFGNMNDDDDRWRKFVYTWWITLFLLLFRFGISRDSLNDFFLYVLFRKGAVNLFVTFGILFVLITWDSAKVGMIYGNQ